MKPLTGSKDVWSALQLPSGLTGIQNMEMATEHLRVIG